MAPPAELLRAIAGLPDEANVTITVSVRDLRSALEQRAGGPEILDCRQAATLLGYRPERWRRWAEEGRIPGAYQDADRGPWRLPREACEAHIRTLRRTSTTGAAREVIPFDAGKARGPRQTTRPPAA